MTQGFQSLAREELIWVLGSLCGLHRIPFDPQLLAQSYPPPYSRTTLLEAAGALGFRAGRASLAAVDLSALHAPVIAFLRAVPQAVDAVTE